MTNTLVDPRLFHPNTGRAALFLAPSGRLVFSHRGADGDEGGDEDEGSEDDGEDDKSEEDSDKDEEDDADDKDAKGKDGKGKKSKARVIDPEDYDEQVTHKERLRKQLSEADKKRAAAEKGLADLKKSTLPDKEKAAAELAEVTTERDSYKEKFTNLARTNAFLTASAQEEIVWADPEDAQAVAGKSLRELDISDDGDVDGIRELVKSLARKKPHLVKQAKGSDDGDKEDKDKSKRRNGASGSGVGSRGARSNGAKKGQLTDEQLVARFPALRRH